jgi:hypothetical protein
LFSGVPNSSSTIVCIWVQWNHSDLTGCAPRARCWLGGVQLSRAEETDDRHWTVTVVGADQGLEKQSGWNNAKSRGSLSRLVNAAIVDRC